MTARSMPRGVRRSRSSTQAACRTPARRRRSHDLILVTRHYSRRHKARLRHLARQLAFKGLAPPQIKQSRRQGVAACCRLQPPRPIQAFLYDPKFCRSCPASARSGLDHLQTRHLRYSRISTHTTIHSSIAPSPQGGSGRRLTKPSALLNLTYCDQLFPRAPYARASGLRN